MSVRQREHVEAHERVRRPNAEPDEVVVIVEYRESVQKLGRQDFVRDPWLTAWLHGLFCPSAAACPRWPDAFAVTRVGNLERRDARRRDSAMLLLIVMRNPGLALIPAKAV
jgi:hypothetical protein